MKAPIDISARKLINSLVQFILDEKHLNIEEIWFVNLNKSNNFEIIKELTSDRVKKYIEVAD